jgi:PAS domain S-box-containing protein
VTPSLAAAIVIAAALAVAVLVLVRLRLRESHFRSLVEGADDVILRIDALGRIAYANPATGELLGTEAASLVGRPFLEIVRPDYREQARAFYEDQRQQGIPMSYCEFPVAAPDGADLWLGQRAQLVTAGGRAVGLHAVARNVTERTLLQQAIEREREQLRQIVAHAPVAMAMLDRDLRHLAHSARWLRYLAPGEPSVVGRTLQEIWPTMPARYQQVFERALAGEVVSEPEDALERDDGSTVFMRWTVHPWRDAHGKVAGVVLAAQSIDVLVRARQAALEGSRLKSEFVANMSHEIRTPMNGVIGMTRLLLDTPLTSEQREYAEVIDQSGRALLEIINDILDFSKIEAGRIDLELVDFDLRRAVREVLGSFAEAAHAKGLELLCLIRHDVPNALRGDPGRLRQVLTNLVGNAVKFTEKGEVVLRVTLDESGDDTALVRFEVRDTGIGIDGELKPRLFQSFVQADGSASRRHGGTGLGLAISKRLVSLMGGSIDVDSRPGRGSTFWFTVRLERQGEAAPVPPPSARLAGRRALVVDDNATNRQILRHQLGYWGLRVTAVESGPRGLALLQQAGAGGTGYDIAILDMKMPEMDGLALARAIKQDQALASVRLVLLTSFGQRGHGAEAAKIGIAAYLTKPVDEADLYDCLVEVLDEARAGRGPHLVTRHSLREQRLPIAAHVLVAEDNEVNQKVAVKILEKLGYRVELAENGKEALAACARRRYDAVLMDGQMPGMDGYEATRRIRERETRGGRRLPIIAMTASAMKGDREKCLESGMDDYVAKPVTPENLEAALRKWVGAASAPAERAAAEPAVEGALLDETVVQSLMSVDDDGTLMDEIVATFLRIAPARLAAIKKAARGNPAMLEREAHSFLGSCGNIGARRMAETCARLEVLGRSGSTEGAVEIARTLEEELVSVRPQLEALPGRHPKRAGVLPSRP